jgi:hypothetical protein
VLLDKVKQGNQRPEQPTFSQYHYAGWRWDRVDRMLVLPCLNESQFNRAGDEVRAAFTSELQRVGLFEVVDALADDRAVLAAQIHRGGRFDEAAMLKLADDTKADVVLHAIVTHYSPYPRPRIGLIVQAVSPKQAKVIASVDGLWDTTDCVVAERCRSYYRQRSRPRLPFVRNNLVVTSDDEFAADLALESPALFQRWVCHEVVYLLLGIQGQPGASSRQESPLGSGVNSQAGSGAEAGAAKQTACDPVPPTAPTVNVK